MSRRRVMTQTYGAFKPSASNVSKARMSVAAPVARASKPIVQKPPVRRASIFSPSIINIRAQPVKSFGQQRRHILTYIPHKDKPHLHEFAAAQAKQHGLTFMDPETLRATKLTAKQKKEPVHILAEQATFRDKPVGPELIRRLEPSGVLKSAPEIRLMSCYAGHIGHNGQSRAQEAATTTGLPVVAPIAALNLLAENNTATAVTQGKDGPRVANSKAFVTATPDGAQSPTATSHPVVAQNQDNSWMSAFKSLMKPIIGR